MIKVPIRYLATFQDVLKFLTLSFAAVVTLDFADCAWFQLDHLAIPLSGLIAIILVLASLWIVYLSSINSIVRPCMSNEDLDFVPAEGTLFSVYATKLPCTRKAPILIEGSQTTQSVATKAEHKITISLVDCYESDGVGYLKDISGAIYTVGQEVLDYWIRGKSITLGKKYTATLDEDLKVVQIAKGGLNDY